MSKKQEMETDRGHHGTESESPGKAEDDEGEFWLERNLNQNAGKLHLTKECSRISGEVEKVNRKQCPHRDICRVCSGDYEPHSEDSPFELRDKLLGMSPDEVCSSE